jgi:hypothetical protein
MNDRLPFNPLQAQEVAESFNAGHLWIGGYFFEVASAVKKMAFLSVFACAR